MYVVGSYSRTFFFFFLDPVGWPWTHCSIDWRLIFRTTALGQIRDTSHFPQSRVCIFSTCFLKHHSLYLRCRGSLLLASGASCFNLMFSIFITCHWQPSCSLGGWTLGLLEVLAFEVKNFQKKKNRLEEHQGKAEKWRNTLTWPYWQEKKRPGEEPALSGPWEEGVSGRVLSKCKAIGWALLHSWTGL